VICINRTSEKVWGKLKKSVILFQRSVILAKKSKKVQSRPIVVHTAVLLNSVIWCEFYPEALVHMPCIKKFGASLKTEHFSLLQATNL